MKIASLTLDGVLGVPDGTYSFLGRDERPAAVVLVRGDEASGKTSFLRAISAVKEHAGAYGAPPRPSALRKRGRSSGRIAATWILTEEEQRLGGLDRADHGTELILDDAAVQRLVSPGLRRVMTNLEPAPRTGRLEMIPAQRRLVANAEVAPGPLDGARRAQDDADKYAGLGGWLLDCTIADGAQALRGVDERGLVTSWDRPDSLAGVRAAIATLLPDLRLRRVDRTAAGYRILFDRRDGAVLDLFDLSTSERDAVLLALVVHRHQLDHSIVLLDEPTSTLSASKRAARLRSFVELGADMQVIAATSAPELCRACPRQLDLPLDPARAR